MDGNELVAGFIREATWAALPAPVRRKVKACLLDTLGAVLSGCGAPVSQIAVRFATRLLRGDEATILLSPLRASAAGAAFANGSAANAYDSDDIGQYTKGHPGAQLFPTALAAAEVLHKSGAELLTAMVVGYEVAHRTGRCWHDHHETYQACGSWGSVANAAAAAHLMQLDGEQIRNALGIAEYHAPNLPMLRDLVHPAMVKHGIGWAAMTGTMAAELAAMGFTGIPSILGFEQYRDWVADIGQHYIMAEGAFFKEHCGCGWTHAAVDAGRLLRQRHAFDVADIERITVEGFEEMVTLGSQIPTTTEEAQFNTGWSLTMMLLDGEIGPRQEAEERLADRRAVELIQKITLVEAPELTALAHLHDAGDPAGTYACRVTIMLRDGQTLASGQVSSGNTLAQQWDEARVEGKFRHLLEGILPEPQVAEIADMVGHLDAVASVAELVTAIQRR